MPRSVRAPRVPGSTPLAEGLRPTPGGAVRYRDGMRTMPGSQGCSGPDRCAACDLLAPERSEHHTVSRPRRAALRQVSSCHVEGPLQNSCVGHSELDARHGAVPIEEDRGGDREHAIACRYVRVTADIDGPNALSDRWLQGGHDAFLGATGGTVRSGEQDGRAGLTADPAAQEAPMTRGECPPRRRDPGRQ